MNRRSSPGVPARQCTRFRASIVLELLMALPVMVMAMDLVVRITFDAAFMTGLSLATIEAAREAGHAFARGVPVSDPHGEPSFDPRDGDDVADRVAFIVQRRLQILQLSVVPTHRRGEKSDLPGVLIVMRRNGEISRRGNPDIPLRSLASAPLNDELELTIAVRMSRLSLTSTDVELTKLGSRGWLGANVIQCSARVPME